MFLIQFISLLSTTITILVIAHVILSWVMSPYHPVRQAVDMIVAPMLDPIRRIMPSTGMIDFSPLVLIILVRVIEVLLIGFLRSI